MSPSIFTRIYEIIKYMYSNNIDQWNRDYLNILQFAWPESYKRISDFFIDVIIFTTENREKDLKHPLKSAIGKTLRKHYNYVTRNQVPIKDREVTYGHQEDLLSFLFNNGLQYDELYLLYNLSKGHSMSDISDSLLVTRATLNNHLNKIKENYVGYQ
jgi:hypothetical protein